MCRYVCAFVAIVGCGLLPAPGITRIGEVLDVPAARTQGPSVVPLELAMEQLDAGDPDFLEHVLGTARVVAFGEAEHGIREMLLLRNRMLEYLVERHGFTAMVAETGFLAGIEVDAYISGSHSVTRSQAVEGVWSFRDGSNPFEENRELVDWMRAWNEQATPARRVRFYGINPLAGVPARRLYDSVLDYLRAVDGEQAREFHLRLAPFLRKVDRSSYHALRPSERAGLALATADLVALLERRHMDWVQRGGALAYHHAFGAALNARAVDAWLRNDDPRLNQRDAVFAANVRWALEREGGNGRLFLFAHAGHVRKGPMLNADGVVQRPVYTSMGQHLHEVLQEDFVVVGAVRGVVRDPSRLLYNPSSPWFLDAAQSFDAMVSMAGPIHE